MNPPAHAPRTFLFRTLLAALLAAAAPAQAPPGEGPALGTSRLTQADIVANALDLDTLRRAGLEIFSTSFNRYDGLGDGPMSAVDPTAPGGRPTLGNNGMLLRVNGLDAQSCLECHSVLSTATVPPTFAIGGHAGSASNVIAQPRTIDVADSAGNGFAALDGRFINPPFVFGAGGIELLGKEMTSDLQRLARHARANPGLPVPLVTHGVDFGTLSSPDGVTLDTSAVEGVDPDLVVRPFGRKGAFATTRAFDVEAMRFHFGMEPTEVVGDGVDADGDGVVNEILAGELSALEIFNTNLEPPVQDPQTPESRAGFGHFQAIGCADCHVPALETRGRLLTYSFPEIHADPAANVFFRADLAREPAAFPPAVGGGIVVRLFSDLKRHDMGPGLAESTGGALDAHFITARLWGVADSAPYLHDGRASTLTEAILAHGGEAQAARDAFAALGATQRIELLAFLRTLRTPTDPAADLLE